MYLRAYKELLIERIRRDQVDYPRDRYDVFAADLKAIAWFFDKPWERIVPGLPPEVQGRLLYEAGFDLRALGSLEEAVLPMYGSLAAFNKAKQLADAAKAANTLGQILLLLGDPIEPERYARLALKLANTSGDIDAQVKRLANIGDLMFNRGKRDQAMKCFRKAEKLLQSHARKSSSPDSSGLPKLYSWFGFRYCECLLGGVLVQAWRAVTNTPVAGATGPRMSPANQELCKDVRRRAEESKALAKGMPWRLIVGLDSLTLAQLALVEGLGAGNNLGNQLLRAQELVNEAVEEIRESGRRDRLPNALGFHAMINRLADRTECARTDLDEAWQIAESGCMRLCMADLYLYRARLFHTVRPYPWREIKEANGQLPIGHGPKDDLASARRLIEQCKYGRRKWELEDAEAAAKNWS
jgi:tetratricopeptide (TPR) repeat protein